MFAHRVGKRGLGNAIAVSVRARGQWCAISKHGWTCPKENSDRRSGNCCQIRRFARIRQHGDAVATVTCGVTCLSVLKQPTLDAHRSQGCVWLNPYPILKCSIVTYRVRDSLHSHRHYIVQQVLRACTSWNNAYVWCQGIVRSKHTVSCICRVCARTCR